MIGYAPNATTSATLDRNYDAPSFITGTDIYSLSPAGAALTIQGRQLGATFNVNDVIPLGITCPSGSNTISATDFDGLFTTQLFWLRENDGGVISYHNIRTTPYNFNAVSALSNNTTRFQIVFTLPTTANINSSNCNTTIGGIWNTFFFSAVSGVSSYHIMAVPTNTGLPTIQFNTTVPRFQIAPYGFSYNTTYAVFVATFQVDNQWIYNTTPCTFTTPASPNPSTIYDPVCGATITNRNYIIRANPLEGMAVPPTSYQFIVNYAGTNYPFTSTTPTFQLGVVPNLPFVADGSYTITVNVNWNNVVISSPPCTLTLISASPRYTLQDNTEFQAKAYPNPFTNNFKLDISSSGDEKLELVVYDMLGRLMESRTMTISDSYTQEVGNDYASGVYNLVLKQNDNVKTIRIVKR